MPRPPQVMPPAAPPMPAMDPFTAARIMYQHQQLLERARERAQGAELAQLVSDGEPPPIPEPIGPFSLAKGANLNELVQPQANAAPNTEYGGVPGDPGFYGAPPASHNNDLMGFSSAVPGLRNPMNDIRAWAAQMQQPREGTDPVDVIERYLRSAGITGTENPADAIRDALFGAESGGMPSDLDVQSMVGRRATSAAPPASGSATGGGPGAAGGPFAGGMMPPIPGIKPDAPFASAVEQMQRGGGSMNAPSPNVVLRNDGQQWVPPDLRQPPAAQPAAASAEPERGRFGLTSDQAEDLMTLGLNMMNAKPGESLVQGIGRSGLAAMRGRKARQKTRAASELKRQELELKRQKIVADLQSSYNAAMMRSLDSQADREQRAQAARETNELRALIAQGQQANARDLNELRERADRWKMNDSANEYRDKLIETETGGLGMPSGNEPEAVAERMRVQEAVDRQMIEAYPDSDAAEAARKRLRSRTDQYPIGTVVQLKTDTQVPGLGTVKAGQRIEKGADGKWKVAR